MADFVLVHGAWHGAWCWDELIPELEAFGHRAHVLDLPGGGSDATPPQDVTLDACAERVTDLIRSIPGKVWLVGHSMGGMTIAQTAELVPERLEGLVYVAASLPTRGQTMDEAFRGSEQRADAAPDRMQQALIIDEATGCAAVPPETIRDSFYNLCSDEQVDRAKGMLRKWQALGAATTPARITPERGGRVPRYYVECLQDQAVAIEMQRRMHNTAGVTMVATLDADHSPFWSRPTDLAQALDTFARTSHFDFQMPPVG